MNNFQTIGSGQGLLKNNYDTNDDDDLRQQQLQALDKRSDALAEKVKAMSLIPDQNSTLPTLVTANKLRR